MNFLDNALRKVLHIAGVPLPERKDWNIVSGATAVANPTTGALDITIEGGGGESTADEVTWTPSGAPGAEVVSNAFELVHDGSPADQEVFRVAVPDAYSTTWKVIAQCAGPNGQFYYIEWRAAWMRDGTLVQEKDTPNSSGTASANEAGYGAVLALDGTDGVLTATGEGTWTVLLTRVRTVNGTAPVVISVTGGTGDPAGGESVTIAGARFVTGAQVTFDGVAATGESVANQNSMTCTTPAHAGGPVDVVVTNPDTKTGTLAGGYTYVSSFDITSLDWTGLWLDHAGTVTPAVASAGTSLATGDLVANHGAPSNTAAQNGHIGAACNGTSQDETNSTIASDLYTTTQSCCFAVFRVTSTSTPTGSTWDDVRLISDYNADYGIRITDNGVEGIGYSGGFKPTGPIAIPGTPGDGQFHIVGLFHDGVNLTLKLDSEPDAVIACGTLGILIGLFVSGDNYAGIAPFFHGELWGRGTAKINHASDWANIKGYFETRLGITFP